MQEDMHYYGTYAMARAAGLKVEHAQVIAYAAQYVDDSTANDSDQHEDGGMFETTATAHTKTKFLIKDIGLPLLRITDLLNNSVEKLQIVLPDLEKTVKAFDPYFKDIFNKIKNNTKEIQTLQKTRDILLPKLLSGELEV